MRRIAGVCVALLVGLAGSCGDDGDGQAQTIEPTSETTGDDSTDAEDPEPTGEDTTTTAETPSEADLEAIALQLDELPDGYTVDEPAGDEESDNRICGIDPTPGLSCR
jgi:hypothetical protein